MANTLKPLVFVGKNGLSEAVLDSIDQALQDHELIKVRFLEFKDRKKTLCEKIREQCKCEWVGLVGHVAIFYRQQPDIDKRRINLD